MTPQEAVIHAAQEVPHYESCAGLRGPNECDCGVVAALERLALASLPDQAVEPGPLDVERLDELNEERARLHRWYLALPEDSAERDEVWRSIRLVDGSVDRLPAVADKQPKGAG
jgi:hypothetical protein